MKYHHIKKLLLFSMLIMVGPLGSFAQRPDLRFERITNQSGRSLGFTTGILQDSIGFMWFATHKGLYRYDGYVYKRFTASRKDPLSLPHSSIDHLYYDSQGRLWGKHMETFFAFRNEGLDTTMRSLTDSTYLMNAQLQEDSQGKLWIAPTRTGALRYDPQTGGRRPFDAAEPQYPQSLLDAMEEAKDQALLAGITDAGNETDTLLTFRLEDPQTLLIASAGEMSDNRRFDYGKLLDADGNVLWEMHYASSRHAGGSTDNKVEATVLELPAGEYQLHYQSDKSHSYNDWKSPAPDKINFYGIWVAPIAEDMAHKVLQGAQGANYPKGSLSSAAIKNFYTAPGKVYLFSLSSVDVYHIAEDTIVRHPLDFTPYVPAYALGDMFVMDIIRSHDGHFWLATKYGLFELTENFRIHNHYHKENAARPLAADQVYALFEDKQRRLWIGTAKGLNLLDRSSGDIYTYRVNVHNRLYGNLITDIYSDNSNNIWVATSEGLNRLIPKRFFYVPLRGEGYSSFPRYYDHAKQQIWFRGEANTLYRYNRRDNSYMVYDLPIGLFPLDDLTGERWYAFSDIKMKGGLLWFAVNDRLAAFSPTAQKIVDSLKIPAVQLEDGQVDNTIAEILPLPSAKILVLSLDGIHHYAPASGRITRSVSFNRSYEGLYGISEYVKAVLLARPNELWLRTVAGILRYDIATGQLDTVQAFSDEIRYTSAIEGNLHLDKNGKIWCAFLPYIFQYDLEGETARLDTLENIGDVGACNIQRDSSGLLWIATENGLFSWEPQTQEKRYYDSRENLAGDNIHGVFDDGRGHIYIMGTKALSVLDKKNERFNLLSYDFPEKRFVAIRTGGHQMHQEVLFTTENGYYSFFPDSINKQPPNVVITSFKMYGEEMELDSLIYAKNAMTLRYNQNFFTFEFSALDYTNPSANRYRYKLEGLDKTWIETGAGNRTAPYTSVPPGHYVLRIQGSNNDEVWSGQDRTLKITIIPPIWKRPWAYVIYVLVITGSVIYFIRWREQNLKREKRVLEIKVAERTVEIERQNEELAKQRDIARQQRDQIAEQKQSITDSIQYARRIQQAVLPPEDFIQDILPEHFILNKPRDIVSGDYYWMAQRNGRTVVVAADCTGHGVPGAFMSMLGVAFLNEIVNRSDVRHANEILNELRSYVIKSLHQNERTSDTKDGMDLALCVLDTQSMILEYSGAFNPLYLIRQGELIKVKADRMPIGIYFRRERGFTNHEIDIRQGDRLYIFSDGYVDQFGGEKGRKFMAKNFQNLLIEHHEKPMGQQRKILDDIIEDWKGTKYEQVDDILVVGLKV